MSDTQLRVGLIGATGRMGSTIRQLIEDDVELQKRFSLVWAAEGPRDPVFAKLESARPAVVIDFSAPECSLATSEICGKLRIPQLVCTTGFTADEKARLARNLEGVAWGFIPNTSLGVFALGEGIRAVLRALPESFTVSIVESHHRFKKDKPSGTAKLLREDVVSARPGMKQEVDMLSLRGGDEIGEHTVVVLGPAERIELTHRAVDRSLFARGAFELAGKLVKAATKLGPKGALSPADLFPL
jgi:4-hydroxy-tetrahydrodipicolinate reductase